MRKRDRIRVLDWFDPWPFESTWDIYQGLDGEGWDHP